MRDVGIDEVRGGGYVSVWELTEGGRKSETKRGGGVIAFIYWVETNDDGGG
jgi:hypothetical protein